MEEEDRRRETAMAATPLLQPNFQSSSISHIQLHKLKKQQRTSWMSIDGVPKYVYWSSLKGELRRRRLQIKKNTSSSKKMKGKKNGDRTTTAGEVSATNDIIQTECQQSIMPEEPLLFTKNEDADKISKKHNALLPGKKQHKLHWGLDTKERWERKANM